MPEGVPLDRAAESVRHKQAILAVARSMARPAACGSGTEVLEIVPHQRLSISWAGGGIDTTVTWQLFPEGPGTRLMLSHEGFDDRHPGQQAARRILGGGWSGHLARRLEATLSTMI